MYTQIVAVEASKRTFQTLVENVKNNNTVIPLNYAVCDSKESFVDKKSKIKVKINDVATLILEASTLMLEEGEISIVYKDIPGLPLTKTRVSLSEPLLPQTIVTDILSQLEKYENLRSVPQCSTCPAFLHNRTSDMCQQCELMMCAQQTPCSICTNKDKKIDVWVTTSCNWHTMVRTEQAQKMVVQTHKQFFEECPDIASGLVKELMCLYDLLKS
jgi:hypothetical protein